MYHEIFLDIIHVYDQFSFVSVSVGVRTPIHDYSRKISLNSQLKSSTAPQFLHMTLFIDNMLKGVVLVKCIVNYLLPKNTKICWPFISQ